MTLAISEKRQRVARSIRDIYRDLDDLASAVETADNWFHRGLHFVTLFMALMIVALIGYAVTMAVVTATLLVESVLRM
jgi:hypothetical protein